METSFLSPRELCSYGFRSLGSNVKISRKASFYNASNIEIGNQSRIDDFCVLSAGSGGIVIGNHVHIGVSSTLIGEGRIYLGNFANISSRVAVYSSNDDYSGEWMTNPTVPSFLTNRAAAHVVISEHVIIGCGAVVLPGVVMEKASGAGALSLIKESCEAFGMYAGNPARRVGTRSSRCLELTKNLGDKSS